MKEKVECLREFEGLKEAEQSGYLVLHGTCATENATTFPDLPYSGAVISSHSLILLKRFALKKRSQLDMASYIKEKALCNTMMDANYNYINGVAGGNGKIVKLAGVKGTSINTTRTDAPSEATNMTYVFLDSEGEIQIIFDKDKLAWGALILTFISADVKVKKTGKMQITITVKDVKILLDLTTTSKATIKNLKKGDAITTIMGLFNPNGLSPLGGPEGVSIPK